MSRKGGKTMTEKRRAALAVSVVKARAALLKKRKNVASTPSDAS